VRLLGAEVLKLRTAPFTALALSLGMLAIVGLGSASSADSADDDSGFPPGADVARPRLAWDLLDVSTASTFFSLIFGILVITWEYRHGTITPTFLVTPRRERVVAAKIVVAALAGFVLAASALGLAFLIGELWVDDVGVGAEERKAIGRILLAGPLWAALGVGLGGVLRSQVGALITAFVWFLIAEPVIGSQLGDTADYFPGNVIGRFLGIEQLRGEAGFGDVSELGLGTAAVLVLAYATAAAAAGSFVVRARDVA